MKQSNLAFYNEIATHLSGARNDRMGKGVHSLNRNLGSKWDISVFCEFQCEIIRAVPFPIGVLFNRKLLMDVFGEAFGYCSGCSLGNKQ